MNAATRRAERYDTVHRMIRRVRGSASDHRCVADGCTRWAAGWAWQHTGPSADGEHMGRAVTYGLDPEDYAPMCKSHHTMLDRGGTLTHCPRGHLRSVGVFSNGTCKQCARDDARERMRRNRATAQHQR